MTVRVLVVDDESDVEALFRQQFRREIRDGLYTLDFALSALAALAILDDASGEKLILLVSDINMPGMSGLDIISEVKVRRPDLPVFMIWDYGDAEKVKTALARGADGFFTKPVDFPKLKQDIMAVMTDTTGGKRMTSPPDDTTTDTSAIIAALRTERDAVLTREEELRAAQAAGLEVLQAMAASPGDTQPVFDLIARRAADLCMVPAAAVAMFDGTLLHLATQNGLDPRYASVYAKQFPRPVGPDTIMGRTILSRRVEQIEDFDADPAYGMARASGHWSAMAAPLLRGAAPLGVIAVARPAIGRFPDNQVTLLQTFAEQAVIAISSAETYRELQARTESLAQRNSEYGERIEHQAATIDVLKAMSASPGDPQPVFDLIVERARDLCDAYGVTVLEFDGGLLHYRAANGVSDDAETREAFAAMYPRPPTRDMPQGRAILDRRTIRIDDLEADQGLNPFYRGITAKSTVVVPLMRGEVAIGTVGIGGRERGGFSGSQIELLQTFAEQAVIAITSAETYRALQTRTADLQETLEYQTATSDVLKVISRSTFDLQPVLDAVVETAARLCDADMAHITRREGEAMHFAANYGFPPEYETYLKSRGPAKLDPNSPTIMHRTWIEGRPVHVDDVAAVPGYPEVYVRLSKQRTSLGVPLLRGGETIGVIQVSRQRVQPFTDRQIALVSTFADQAVIAIENTRLITEQREALEQQTATAEVLQVINTSPGDLAPVFEAILEKAHRLCDATLGSIVTFDGEHFRAEATHGYPEQYAAWMRGGWRAHPQSAQQALIDGKPFVHVADLWAAGPWYDDEFQRAFIEATGVRTFLVVPLRKDRSLLGFIAAHRKEARAFTDKEITLLENFAAQAVIAMENARLITEQR